MNINKRKVQRKTLIPYRINQPGDDSGQTFGFLSDPAYHVFSVFISVYL